MSENNALTSWVGDFVDYCGKPAVAADFVNRIDDVIATQIPEIAGDAMLVQDLHKSTGAQWRSFLAHLSEEHRLVLPSAAADLARSLARRGMDLAILLKVYRVAQQAVYQFLIDVIDAVGKEHAPARDEVLVFIWSRAGQWMDDSVESLIQTFYEERQNLNDGVLIRRQETIEALLGDAPPTSDQASNALSHALQHWQTALLVWSSESSGSATEAMLDVANAVAQALKAPRPLTMVAGSRDLWCWVATPTKPDLGLLAPLEALLKETGTHLAVGLPAPGVGGFRSSHDEARSARELALEVPGVTALVRYDEVELLCILASQDTLARRMVAREIGPLGAADKNLALVRETALVYLTTLNVEATAERLFVHKNTVRYRIAKAEELLGHPLTERSTQVELALRWVAFFGNPAPAG
ncbi:PucR family transcriptional regulator [Nocardioides humilatus]|uniref:PucR family transcriptional regulator n=1 Tax=Nocardioides humilatus TaxID=2607660 RepID=A0A5B1L8P0_9ACTN|nr:helix-turn-helix domain-containing protein [Nocardioides humilatus]KAA1416816.1 PucR family transcriptional regulator [Nocardioides humilatus]